MGWAVMFEYGPHANAQQELNATVFTRLTDALVITDPSACGRILAVNPAACILDIADLPL